MSQRHSSFTTCCAAIGALAVVLILTLAPARDAQAAPTWNMVYQGFNLPIDITHAGDGTPRLFVAEQGGTIRLIKSGVLQATPFLSLGSLTAANGEQGLLGFAFHPQYAANGRFVVNYTRASDGATVIARYNVSAGNPDIADPASAVVLLTIPQPYANHNGGALKFGPDGLLYIGTGDGGSGNDPEARAQDRTSLLGKLLRINIDSGTPYSIPPGNPFPTGVGGRAEIFSVGLRNPWRIAFDRGSGDLWIGDVGQNTQEEIDRLAAGTGANANFGWRVLEGTFCTGLSGPVTCTDPTLTAPVLTYGRGLGQSVTGGYVYRGTAVPSLAGRYVYADFVSGRIWAAQGSGSAWTTTELADTGFNVSTFGEDGAGELYFADYGNGDIYRFAETPAPTPVLQVAPLTLSFGSVTAGVTSATQTATVTNAGGGTLALSALTAGGTNPADFNRTGTCTATTTLTAAQTCTLVYSFTPAAVGARSATLAVASNAGNASVSLSGTGTAPPPAPLLQVAPLTLAFGSVTVGVTSATQTATVTNAGGGTLALSALTAGGTNPADFNRTGTCTATTTLTAAQTCTLVYSFTPAAAGARSATLAVASNAGNASVSLSGTGAAPPPTPVLQVAPLALAFGSVNVGVTSTDQTATVTNSGGGSLVLTALTAGGTEAAEFVRTGTCTATTTLTSAQTCTLVYRFTPTATGARSASLAIASNAGNASLALTGTGATAPPPTTAVLTVAPATLAFGGVTVGSSSIAQSVTIVNTGTGSLVLSSLQVSGADAAEFARTGSCTATTALAAAQTCSVTFVFSPLAAGARNAALAIVSNAGNATVPLTGTGVAVPPPVTLTASPPGLVFGLVNIGAASATMSVSLSNAGSGTATITGFTMGGENPAEFVRGGSCGIGTSLTGSQSCTLTFIFVPAIVGARSASVAVSSSGGTATVTLAGTGVTAGSTLAEVVEFYHAAFDHYFISPLAADIAALDSGVFKGWARTGRVFKAFATPQPGSSPVCRFYIPPAVGDSHFFSASPIECAEVRVKFPGFTEESTAAMYMFLPNLVTGACPADSIPIYRVWNARVDSNHRYVNDRALRDQMLAMGYVREGYGVDGVGMCSPL